MLHVHGQSLKVSSYTRVFWFSLDYIAYTTLVISDHNTVIAFFKNVYSVYSVLCYITLLLTDSSLISLPHPTPHKKKFKKAKIKIVFNLHGKIQAGTVLKINYEVVIVLVLTFLIKMPNITNSFVSDKDI